MSVSTSSAKLPDDLLKVRRQLVEAAATGQFETAIDALLLLLVQARDTNSDLTVRLAQALRLLYGRKTQSVSADQLKLALDELGLGSLLPSDPTADGGQVPQPELPGDDEHDSDDPKKARPKKKHRKPLPDHLPKDIERKPLPDELRPCPFCQTPRVTIGWRPGAPVLEFVPASFKLLIEERETVVCPKCEDPVSMDRADSDKLQPAARPGPGLLAQLIVDKLDNSLPLERQAKNYARLGVELSTSTLGDWFAFGIDCLRPLYDAVVMEVKKDFRMNVDDTGLLALDRR